jgi:hypothetical protein
MRGFQKKKEEERGYKNPTLTRQHNSHNTRYIHIFYAVDVNLLAAQSKSSGRCRASEIKRGEREV